MKAFNTLSRRQLARVAGACFALCALGAAAQGSYPTKPVRIVVGFSAGGTTDIVARIMARELTADLGQSFVVDNKPGGGSNIATDMVAAAAPDGYTLLFVAVTSGYLMATGHFDRSIAPSAPATSTEIVQTTPAQPVAVRGQS